MDERSPYSPSRSWFKTFRCVDALQLIKRSRNAFSLAAVIVQRAWYRNGFNAEGCGFGEALIGDYKEYGMTRQEHRSALVLLCKSEFVTTRTTNKGTYAKLRDTRLYEVIPLTGNHQSSQRAAIKQPASSHQVTTNIEQREQKSRGKRALWQLLRDEETLTKRIRQESESTKPDRLLIESLKAQRRHVRDEMKEPRP